MGDSDGLSQFLLAACNLQGVLLPESSKDETDSDLLSIRDMFRIIFVPNERLDNRSLVFEQQHHMVRQKFRQSIDAMFGIHDDERAFLAARYRTARENARIAEGKARALRQFAESEHPRGPMQLELDVTEAGASIDSLGAELTRLDVEQRSTQAAAASVRRQLDLAQGRAKDTQIRVRDRRSLITRLDALRGQYADDRRKLNFLLEQRETCVQSRLKEAERLTTQAEHGVTELSELLPRSLAAPSPCVDFSSLMRTWTIAPLDLGDVARPASVPCRTRIDPGRLVHTCYDDFLHFLERWPVAGRPGSWTSRASKWVGPEGEHGCLRRERVVVRSYIGR
ncbi:hypothetical protein PWY87_17415 [Kribbella solani]|uniref:hypothetical protein n=1 Tax=Kribbella solani TaxID=236067 RepID=UPI0029A410FD|nr:hypothetical protein [Kribbella solani]MDX2968604.1 hypothetical protein [Kribbella solani]MDX3003470.1 hypothetical protein [Kribbella solani]